MEPEKSDFDNRADLFSGCGSSVSCSICLEYVVDRGERSIAKLQCGHQFHLDCIGSAFNAKGAMQCPNCRKIEKGQWMFANGYPPFAEFNVDELVNEDYDFSYPEPPFGLQWCPFRGGFMQLSSLFEEGEAQSNAYHDMLGSSSFGDHSTATSSTHVCPYLALHGFSRALHPTPSNASEAMPDAGSFHRHPSGLGPSSGDVMNSHGFSATEPRHHNWQQASHPFPVSSSGLNNAEQPASLLASRLSRNDSSGQQRLGSFVQPLPFIHGSVRAGGSLVASTLPPILGDARGLARGHSSHMYQQSASSSIRSAPFTPIRRRPQGLALISSVGTNSSVENNGFNGFSISGSVNPQDGESIGRRFDRFYGWVREGFAPLPWVPIDGESQWWGPVHPNHNPQAGTADAMNRSYYPQRVLAERVAQGRPENRYQRVHLPRMSPFM